MGDFVFRFGLLPQNHPARRKSPVRPPFTAAQKSNLFSFVQIRSFFAQSSQLCTYTNVNRSTWNTPQKRTHVPRGTDGWK